VTLKTVVTGVAAAALVAAAAGGVTSIASTVTAAPAVAPVVFGIPMPEAPADDAAVGSLNQTLAALGAAGPFSSRLPYIEPLGGLTGRLAESQYNGLVKKGVFPLTATISNVQLDPSGTTATGLVSAVSSNGSPHTTTLTFVQNPSSPSGWVLTAGSLRTLSASVSS
jgi:hypothetical protein